MALKKVTRPTHPVEQATQINEEEKNMDNFSERNNNSTNEGASFPNGIPNDGFLSKNLNANSSDSAEAAYCKKVENVIEEVVQNNPSGFDENQTSPEDIVGNMTPLQGLDFDFNSLIEVGPYRFRIHNLYIKHNVDTKFGTKDVLFVDFHLKKTIDRDIIEHHAIQKYNLSSSKSSKLYTLYKSLTNMNPEGKINLRCLLGIIGTCQIRHVSLEDGNVFPEVINIATEVNLVS